MKRVCLGKITGAHGIKGLVKIMPFGDDPYLIEELSPVFTNETGADTLTVKLKNPQGSHFLAGIEGITDRNEAEALKGTELYVPRDVLPEIEDDGSHYIEDLIGREAHDENGAAIGTILGFHNFGAGDIIEIRLKTGKDVMLPLNEDYVPELGETVTIRRYEDFL